ncbi:DNA-binding protein [Noviherbaspirillum cavernae]|uniref:DNA-binding protein n=1 Tax=Noviherbaspirillum cavernae TaxID=2320862 RepID=A0A418WW25_9BURK|nr:Mor transcription activator family protein [Noviherbaspirillum cavernae]RJF96916.1 DNA-binding protein [Noviherbaspirillum cavernae]
MKKDKTGDVIESLADTAAEVLQSVAEMRPEKARGIGESIAYTFAKREGGRQFYLPKNLVHRLTCRDAEIRKKFTGFNHAELAAEYGVTDMRIRQILAKKQ